MHGQTDGRQVKDTSGDTWCCPADVNEEDVASMPGENGCIEIDDLEFESESGKYLFKNFLVIRETLYLRNCSFQVIRESLYPRNFQRFLKN